MFRNIHGRSRTMSYGVCRIQIDVDVEISGSLYEFLKIRLYFSVHWSM